MQRRRSGRGIVVAICAWTAVVASWSTGCGSLRAQNNRSTAAAPGWRAIASAPVAERIFATAIWTGREMIVWGGGAASEGGRRGLPTDGAAYDPSRNLWRPIAAAPLAGRVGHTAIWTGRQMIVWGGAGVSDEPDSFDPSADPDAAPPAKEDPGPFADGAAYDPQRNSWQPIAAAPLAGRVSHTAVWTGQEMIVWGGNGWSDQDDGAFADGAAFDPRRNSWRRLAAAPIDPRAGHTALWTGQAMIVWGGIGRDPSAVGDDRTTQPERGDGAIYDPARDVWRALGSPLTPQDPDHDWGLLDFAHHAVWTGREMITWGGSLLRGGAYEPSTGTWRGIATSPLGEGSGGPSGDRETIANIVGSGTTMVWTGEQVLIWGGSDAGAKRPHGAAYDPGTNRWTSIPTRDPFVRSRHVAVWTGDDMVVWGGFRSPDGDVFTGDFSGAAYRPPQ